MSNYKIRVNSKAESKEAQELFFELDYNWFKKGYMEVKTPETIMSFENGALSTGIRGSINHKEITLPELRDLVVLKRNSIDDATHTDSTTHKRKGYLTCDGVEYFWSYGDFSWKEINIHTFESTGMKPIEKEEMKEYLDKQQDGTYKLIKADGGCIDRDWIEIPEGSETFNFYDRKDNLFFLKGTGDNALFSNDINDWEWKEWGYIDFDGVVCLWSRPTHPEELPFIDDEPSQSLNDQYAEIEKVRQSHRTASEIADSALKHIRERAETYDQPTGERSAAKTAKAFNTITGKDITESEVWLLLQLLKDVRQWSREDYHQDSAEDCIAYASLKAESLEGEK